MLNNVSERDEMGLNWSEKIYRTGDTLLLTAFGEESRENGFLQQVLKVRGRPKILTMGPYLYYQDMTQRPNLLAFSQGEPPLKAPLANCWIVERQTATEAPNYYITTDWKHYRQLSHVSPQARINWLTADILRWRQIDGTLGEGILYKPEDFDSRKKYPVIIHYYEQLTHRLNEFPVAGLTKGDLNIPWFVSRDYLVFTPDIHYRLGRESGKTIGWYAFNAVESAAKFLSTLPYVDNQRLGLQGHSLGALETNYMITHSHRFAAAAEFAGPTDLVSWYLSLAPNWESSEDHVDFLQSFAETGQPRIGATLWKRPELYLEQSAVLRADQVSTPLLITNNKKDGISLWRQAVELYMALRRLYKPVWMLQYDEGDHVIGGKEALDYTLRLTQFFDYYLKGKQPPEWMTVGVPASLKGLDLRLNIDSSGAKP